MVVSKFVQNNSFSSFYFPNDIPFQFVNIFEIQFWYKTPLFLFFSFLLEREEREWLDSNNREIKFLLASIPTMKKIDFGVRE